MPRVTTTYRNPSLADQVTSGRGTKADCEQLLARLKRDGAAPSTIKRVQRAIDARDFAKEEALLAERSENERILRSAEYLNNPDRGVVAHLHVEDETNKPVDTDATLPDTSL